MQADLAYAAERITHDYPEPTGAKKDTKLSTVSDYFRNIRTHSIHPRVSVGYDFGGWRIAADYARYRKWKESNSSVNIKRVKDIKDNCKKLTQDPKTEHQENGTFHAVSSLGLSTIYDFQISDKFKPYIGVRVGYGHVRHRFGSGKKTTDLIISHPTTSGGGRTTYNPNPQTQTPYHQSNSISSLGFGAMAGVGIDVAPCLTLDAGYRYHYWGRLENTRFKTHEASLGVRYRF
ncbi:opacity family porin [Neisseria gonorrhoeae]|uniref:opacity family porin n=1 Tax=Neisseria gonorrhoeae TaxID=485 RepID=UPI001CE0F59F|nr:opacity family porin [Neisseria gonorrhoeae]